MLSDNSNSNKRKLKRKIDDNAKINEDESGNLKYFFIYCLLTLRS